MYILEAFAPTPRSSAGKFGNDTVMMGRYGRLLMNKTCAQRSFFFPRRTISVGRVRKGAGSDLAKHHPTAPFFFSFSTSSSNGTLSRDESLGLHHTCVWQLSSNLS